MMMMMMMSYFLTTSEDKELQGVVTTFYRLIINWCYGKSDEIDKKINSIN